MVKSGNKINTAESMKIQSCFRGDYFDLYGATFCSACALSVLLSLLLCY